MPEPQNVASRCGKLRRGEVQRKLLGWKLVLGAPEWLTQNIATNLNSGAAHVGMWFCVEEARPCICPGGGQHKEACDQPNADKKSRPAMSDDLPHIASETGQFEAGEKGSTSRWREQAVALGRRLHRSAIDLADAI
jgi:hypothetical protein